MDPADDDTRADPLAELVDAAAGTTFVSASFTGAARGATPPAERITVRPVDLAAGRHLQFTTLADGRTTVENVPHADALARFDDLLQAGFGSAYVKTLSGDLQLTRSRKGIAHVVRHRATTSAVDTSHDRSRQRLVEGAAFLTACGISDRDGRIKPTARAKYRQVERFVEILSHTLPDDLPPGTRLRAVDLGCGAGVLTLATFHYLSAVRGFDVHMTGIDTKRELVERLTATVGDLGWTGIEFETASIADVTIDPAPDLVVALHACDTATDDALARAVGWKARWILAAPCCQHDLQAQLDRTGVPDDFKSLLRHGIVRERFGDLLTDSLRAEILRSHGYRSDIIEFVSTEHTGKNLMVRAVRTDRIDDAAADAAEHLATTWGVTPALARAIGYRSTDRRGDASRQGVG